MCSDVKSNKPNSKVKIQLFVCITFQAFPEPLRLVAIVWNISVITENLGSTALDFWCSLGRSHPHLKSMTELQAGAQVLSAVGHANSMPSPPGREYNGRSLGEVRCWSLLSNTVHVSARGWQPLSGVGSLYDRQAASRPGCSLF